MTFEEVRGAIKKRTQEHYNQFPYPAGGITKQHVSPVLFVDGPRGVVCGNGRSTAFPVSMLRGATFDTELEEKSEKRSVRKYLPMVEIFLVAYV